jgi:hypothetical protein
MEKVTIVKEGRGKYWPTIDSFPQELYPLWLLLDQWGHDSEMIISGIKESETFGTDHCSIEKDGNFVTLENNQWDDEDIVIKLRIPLENLYYILRKWEKIEKAGPQEIILEFDGKTISIRSVE